jgi:putative ABC transport system permease protein
MIWSYLKVAWRNARRHPTYTAVNVVGLGVGLAGVLFMTLYVGHELSFDRFHADADRIYRVVQEDTASGRSAQTAGAHAALLAEHVPAIEATVRLAPRTRTITVPGAGLADKTAFTESAFVYADPALFEVFSFKLVRGNPATALAAPGTAVLTPATAQTYFGGADPMGKTLLMYDEYNTPNQIPLTVTGVLAEVPDRSHLTFGVLTSTATLEQQYGTLNQFNWPGLYTYVRIAPQANPAAVEQRATDALAERVSDAPALRLQPLPAIYLNPLPQGEWRASGSKTMVYGLAGIALMVLLLACTNFTNLAIARATKRVQEVGVRKAMGAHRTQLAAQFLGDAFLLTSAALGIAVLLVQIGMPVVGTIVGRDLTSMVGMSARVSLGLVGLAVGTGLLAGAYPALLIARQSPTRALRGLAQVPSGATRLRAGLIVVQFAVSIALVAGTFVVFQQLDHVRTLRLGFDEERIVTLPASGARRSFEPLQEALAARPGVAAVSAVNGLPGMGDVQPAMVARREGQATDGAPVYTQSVGPGFFDLMDIRLLAGRIPTTDASRRSHIERALVLNETAAVALGWDPAEAIGQRVRIVEPGNEANNPGLAGAVAGVVADFHHGSARMRIPATAYYPAQSADVPGLYVISHVLVKLAPDGTGRPLAEHIEGLKAAWERVLPDHPFEASFLDAQIQAQYDADWRLGRAVGGFAGLAILIASLGLFGLVVFAIEQRRKEIGIRKALGASAASVVALFSKEIIRLVVAAFFVGAPVAYIFAQQWLQDFAHRIDLGVGVFVAAGVLALVVALATVGVQAWRAARLDPTTALRSE